METLRRSRRSTAPGDVVTGGTGARVAVAAGVAPRTARGPGTAAAASGTR
jgi:hypothetical protein